jgi:D-alanyl-D-alanine carboxypeptidase
MEYIIPFDTKETGNDILYDWDKLTIEDMKQAMMRHSSNVAANAIARIVGAMILEKK